MADFRQNAPRINTATTGESYSSGGVSTGAAVLGAGANLFSTFVTGADAARKREYAIADEERAQSAELRAQRTEQRNMFEFNQTQNERAAADQIGVDTNDSEMRVLLGTLASEYKFPVENFDFSGRNPEQVRALVEAVAQRRRVEDIASGSGRGSHIAAILNRVQLGQRIYDNSEMAAEYLTAFNTTTGSTGTELAATIMETAQAEEIARANAAVKQRETYRQQANIPVTWGNSQVDAHLERTRRASEAVQRVQNAAAISNGQESIRANTVKRTLPSLTDDIHTLAVEGMQAFYTEVNNQAKLGPLTPSQITTFQNRVSIAQQQFINMVANKTGATAQEVVAAYPFIEELRDNFVDYATGKTAKEVVEARLAVTRGIAETNILNQPTANGRTVADLVARSRIIDDFVPENMSPDARLQIEAQVLPYIKDTIAALTTGAPHTGLTTTQPPGQSGRNPLRRYLDVASGRNLPRTGPSAMPAQNVPLSPGRSISNVPQALRANVGISRSLNARLDSLNVQLGHLNWNSDVSRTDAFAAFVETAADPTTVGTFLIDPKIAGGVNNALTEYTRRVIVGMNEDLGRETGNRIAGGYPSMQYTIPVGYKGAGINNGVVMQERSDGGVNFVVDPQLNDPQQVAIAARVAEVFNTKYAKPIQNIVKAYAHLRQDDPFDYRTSLAVIQSGRAAIGNTGTEEAIKIAAKKLVESSNNQISLEEALDIVRSVDIEE